MNYIVVLQNCFDSVKAFYVLALQSHKRNNSPSLRSW